MSSLNNKKVSIVTVTLECKDSDAPENSYRYEILKQVVQTFGKKDIILLPAGFYSFSAIGSEDENRTVDDVHKLLKDAESDATVCLGIDSDGGNTQLAIAVNKSKIVAKGRKFYPTDKEKENGIQIAESFDSEESGYKRCFECKGKWFYLAVCYDVYGIKRCKIANPGVDAILGPVHFFTQKSGLSRYIRLGFGGASRYWGCPVFSAAVFFEREVTEKWQPGFLFENEVQNQLRIKNSNNGLKLDKQKCDISTEYETAFCYLYTV
jgi:hypothetical protein